MPIQIRILRFTHALLTETSQVYWALLKILVPAFIVVKLLQELGAIDGLGLLLALVMSWVGLPAILGVVWATTLLTNLLTGVVVFFSVASDYALTLEQMTVLGTLMLVGHSLPQSVPHRKGQQSVVLEHAHRRQGFAKPPPTKVTDGR